MTDIIMRDDIGAVTEDGGALLSFPLRFEGLDFVLDIGPGQRADHILAIVAGQHGLIVEDVYLVRDGKDEPLDGARDVHDGGHHRRHHVHHRHPVDVTVSYQATAHSRSFRRHAPLERVLDSAIRAFGIDAAMASEFELVRAGTTEELPLGEHVGHLAGRHGTLALDLVRGDIANGAEHA